MTAMKRRTFLQAAGYTALYGGLVADLGKSAQAMTRAEIAGPDPDLHLLRRISFGPVAQELARVREIGRAAYIEEQLAATDSNVETLAQALYPLINLDAVGTFASTGGGFAIDSHILALQSAMIYRAVFSKAQLREVMVDFWNDHFNTYVRKNPVPHKIGFDRDVIRAHALGNFKTLLKATVRHVEMLHYLDQWMNATGAINENYARELLELHSLGKGGGYSEADMKALSLILSGLSYEAAVQGDLLAGSSYADPRFYPERHDVSEKQFLGQTFPAGGGEAEIDRALDLILSHPGTARFIATKLCRRFVSDDPPAALVDRVAAAFTSSDGDIPSMLRVLLNSAEFAASGANKIKRPMESVIGAVRACGINQYDYSLNTNMFGNPLLGGGVIFQSLTAAGQQPYGWVPPNGYPDSNAYWGNTNSLLYQQKFLVQLSETMSYGRALADPAAFFQQGNSVSANVAKAKTPRQAALNCIDNLLFTKLPPAAEAAALAFVAQADEPDAEVPTAELEVRIKGLVFALLSSPWFLLR